MDKFELKLSTGETWVLMLDGKTVEIELIAHGFVNQRTEVFGEESIAEEFFKCFKIAILVEAD